jgi:hypothetical protein
MPVEFRKFITREMLQNEPDTLFVFGDNLVRRGNGGQAKEMRGESNAIGLPTKRLPNHSIAAYLTDHDLSTVAYYNIPEVGELVCNLLQGRVVVWPEDGIGTGLAKLDEKAPSIRKFYDDLLEVLKKI